MSDTPDTSEQLARRLRSETGGEVIFDTAGRGRYATDASIYQVMPLGVFVPRNEDDVARAIALARELKVPVLPRGAGSSQLGQAVGAALVIDGSRHLREVLALDVDQRTVTVQPGLVLDDLNAYLKPHGLYFPVDVDSSAQATLGGMAGNNASGLRSIAHGHMVHQVVGASAWLSDGELLYFGPVAGLEGRAAEITGYVRGLADANRAEMTAHWPRQQGRIGGYNLDIFDCRSERPYTADGSVNLAHLLIGAEGTLAYFRSLTLKLSPIPAARALGLIGFKTLAPALEAVPQLAAIQPQLLELLDRSMLDPALHGKFTAFLLVELIGEDRASLKTQMAELVLLLGEMGHQNCVTPITDEAAQAALWATRAAALAALASPRGDGRPVPIIDACSVPLKHLPEYADAVGKVLARHNARAVWHGHVGVGMLQLRPVLDMRKAGASGGATQMRKMAEEVSALVRKFKGSFSGPGGDGIGRGEWVEWQFGPRLNEAFRAVKNHMDPAFLFNPGKIVIPPKMDDASLMRFASRAAPRPYRTIELKPALDWAAWNVQTDPQTGKTSAVADNTGGLAKAVEMCDGNGQCRSFRQELMCPSYRLSEREQDLPRGRANTLRLALSGQLGEGEGIGGEAVRAAMDLCVGCKGCRRECPNGVDIARMKIEARTQRAATVPLSRRERAVANLPDFAGRRAWLMALRDKWPFATRLSEKWFGLSARRPLPRWRKDTFWTAPDAGLFSSLDDTLAAAPRAAVLFVDTFNGSFETENALAAARVLKAAGYTVHRVQKAGGQHHCCGRTHLVNGQVAEAKARLGALVDALLPLARAGVAVVGLEPACLLTLRDEALVMGLGEAAELVAAQALLFEEFVAREAGAGRLALNLKPAGAPILLHGHCHTKAFGAVTPILDVLRLIPGAAPELIESSCCGMAGGFGYEVEHYEASMQIAELSLLPAIRANADAIVVADGTSCRQQIAHGAQREALHVARLLDRLLA